MSLNFSSTGERSEKETREITISKRNKRKMKIFKLENNKVSTNQNSKIPENLIFI